MTVDNEASTCPYSMGWYVYRLSGSSSGSSSSSSSKRVTVKKSAKYYSPTSKAISIPSFVKGASWKVLEEQAINYSRSNREYLIIQDNGTIIGWILSQDIEGGYDSGSSSSSSKDSRNFANGSKVKIRSKASKYQTGQNIPSSVKGKTYTVMQKKSVNQSSSTCAYLLKEIMSWVLVQDLDQVSSGGSSSGSSGLKGSNLPNSGTYRFTSNTNIRAGAGTNYAIVGSYNAGGTVNYFSKVTAGGYVWLAYKATSGNTRYVAVV